MSQLSLLSVAGTPVHVEVGNRNKLLFKPIIVRSAPFYQNIYGSLAAIRAGTLCVRNGPKRARLCDDSDL